MDASDSLVAELVAFSMANCSPVDVSPSREAAGTHLSRLAESGGAPVRVDTHGPDLKLLVELVSTGYAPNRAEADRKAMREAHDKWKKNA